MATAQGIGTSWVIADGVAVTTPEGGEARIEISRDFSNSEHPYVVGQGAIDPLSIQLFRGVSIKVSNLASCMHSRIGSSSTGEFNALPRQVAEHPLQLPLDRALIALPSSTGEIRAVVSDIQTKTGDRITHDSTTRLTNVW